MLHWVMFEVIMHQALDPHRKGVLAICKQPAIA